MIEHFARAFLARTKQKHGKAFLTELYNQLKLDNQLEEAKLEHDMRRTVQLRPEHDIRSRLLKNRG